MPRLEKILSLKSLSPDQTRRIGSRLGKELEVGVVFALNGDLGSGKTVFVQGLAKGLGVKNPKEIRSPTFAIIQEHSARIPLCHVDLYRLAEPEVRNLGLEEYWIADSSHPSGWVVAVEWAQKARGLLPSAGDSTTALRIDFKFESEKTRTFNFFGNKKWKKILKKIKF